jgi:uncharacterized membrane protein YqaE (UPF0057 family)
MRKGLFYVVALFTILTATNFDSTAAYIIPVKSSTPSGEPDPATLRSAFKEFSSLSKKEKKSRFKEVKKEIKAFKAAKKRGEDPGTNTILLAILAILLPPLAVYLHQGEFNAKFWISLLLCFLAFVTFFLWIVPVVFALLVVLNLI